MSENPDSNDPVGADGIAKSDEKTLGFHDAVSTSVPALHQAVLSGDAQAVLKMLVQGANPNVEDAVFGEPPLFEAAVIDSPPLAVLLMLFSADISKSGRLTSATAIRFAPDGGAVAELLASVVQGDTEKSMVLGKAAIAPIIDSVALGSPEAIILDLRLRSLGHPGVFACRANVGCWSGTEVADDITEKTLEAPTFIRDKTDIENRNVRKCSPPPPCFRAVVDQERHAREKQSEETLSSLRKRLAQNPRELQEGCAAWWFINSLATNDVPWATFAKFAPREALAVIPTTSATFAGIVLGELEDGCWQLAVSLLIRSQDEPACNPELFRRVYTDGDHVPWRDTFRELTTQCLYSWGVDGVVTGFGSRSPQKMYSSPAALCLGLEAKHSLVQDISCGARHAAVSTFTCSVYAWGRDVVPPNRSIDEAPATFLRRGRNRTVAWDRPRRVVDPDIASPRLRDTLLILAGGWVLPKLDIQAAMEDGTDLSPGRSRTPELPPIRKIIRKVSFTIGLAFDGQCFIWGGLPNRVSRRPKALLPTSEVVVDIAAGDDHVVILTERGQVWTYGWRHRAALGRGPRPVTLNGKAVQVAGLDRIVQIGAGATFSICVDMHGCLWMFGEGHCTTGCFGDPLSVYQPRRVPQTVFGGRRVLSAGCGEGHLLILTAWDPLSRFPQPGAWFSKIRGE